jgi:RimJ/RimL family protein N-acetyltransferase
MNVLSLIKNAGIESKSRVNNVSITEALQSVKRENPLEIKSIDNIIILRQYTLSDSKEAFELIDRNRKHLSQFGNLTSKEYPTLDSFKEMINNPKDPNSFKFGIRNDKNVLLGNISLFSINNDSKIGEIRYYLGSEFQGKGYMTKAVQTLTNYAFDILDYKKLYAKVVKGNDASIRVLEKNNYLYAGSNLSLLSFYHHKYNI